MNKFGSFLFGAIVGGVTGGILALLFTPLKGADVRTRIENSFVHVKNEVKTAAQTRMGELNQQLAKLQNKVIE